MITYASELKIIFIFNNQCLNECENNSQINSAASLLSLGTLVSGVPSKTIGKIPATELLQASANTNFISNLLTAPTVIQEIVVQKVHTTPYNSAITSLLFATTYECLIHLSKNQVSASRFSR